MKLSIGANRSPQQARSIDRNNDENFNCIYLNYMMTSDRKSINYYDTISKYLSKHLRHQPERLGLKLLPGGWVNVDDLLLAAAQDGFEISLSDLQQVVITNDKQRFAFDLSGLLIRANQGHSTDIDLQLTAQIPPALLYHGTPVVAVTNGCIFAIEANF